jgi:hypothetical protein
MMIRRPSMTKRKSTDSLNGCVTIDKFLHHWKSCENFQASKAFELRKL